MYKILWDQCVLTMVGPFRWVCASGKSSDLEQTDQIACKVLNEIMISAPKEIQEQMADNIKWIKGAQKNNLVVGSKAKFYMQMQKVALKLHKPLTKRMEKVN